MAMRLLTTQAAMTGGITSIFCVNSKMMTMAESGAWVVAATMAPMVTSA